MQKHHKQINIKQQRSSTNKQTTRTGHITTQNNPTLLQHKRKTTNINKGNQINANKPN